MTIWGAVVGMSVGVIVSFVSFFVGAWVYRQDHPVPIGIFGMVMFLAGIVATIGLL